MELPGVDEVDGGAHTEQHRYDVARGVVGVVFVMSMKSSYRKAWDDSALGVVVVVVLMIVRSQ